MRQCIAARPVFFSVAALCFVCGCSIALGYEEPDICALVQIDEAGATRINGRLRPLQDVFAPEFRSSSGETIVVLCPEYSMPVAEFLRVQQELSDRSLVGRQLGRPVRLLYSFPLERQEFAQIFGYDAFAFAGRSSLEGPWPDYRCPDLVLASGPGGDTVPPEVIDGAATMFVRQAADGTVLPRWAASESEPVVIRKLHELALRVMDHRITRIDIRADDSVVWGVVDQIATRLGSVPNVEIYVSAASLPEIAPFAYHDAAHYLPPPPVFRRREVVRTNEARANAPNVPQEAERFRFESCFTGSTPAEPDDSR